MCLTLLNAVCMTYMCFHVHIKIGMLCDKSFFTILSLPTLYDKLFQFIKRPYPNTIHEKETYKIILYVSFAIIIKLHSRINPLICRLRTNVYSVSLQGLVDYDGDSDEEDEGAGGDDERDAKRPRLA